MHCRVAQIAGASQGAGEGPGNHLRQLSSAHRKRRSRLRHVRPGSGAQRQPRGTSQVNTRSETRLDFELGFLAWLAVLWGSSYLLIKVAIDTVSPTMSIAVRVVIAALFLIIVMSCRPWCRFRRGAIRPLVLAARFGHVSHAALAWRLAARYPSRKYQLWSDGALTRRRL